MTADDCLLRGRALHAWYGSTHVLHGVDIDIGPGETLGLLGRNGMGKSTLIRTLLGHVAQREAASAWPEPTCRARPHEVARRGVAYVPEGRGVFANLSVRENLVMAARPPQRRVGGWGLERLLQTFPRLAEPLHHLRRGHAILLVEHDMDAVFRVADRITVMVNGRVLASGTPDDVRRNEEVQDAYLGAH